MEGRTGNRPAIPPPQSDLVLDVLGGTDAQVGWISSAQAVGGLIGGVVVAQYGSRFTKRWLLGGGMIGLGLADMAQFNARRVTGPGTPAVMWAMGCLALAGVLGEAIGIVPVLTAGVAMWVVGG